MSNVADLMDTINVLKGVYGSTNKGALAPDVMKDFTTSLGLVPYNLEQGARLLQPVITPLRNAIPRNKGRGTATEFKAVTSYNATGVSGWVAEGLSQNTGGTPLRLTTTVVDVLMKYKIASMLNYVTFESQFFGAGQVDAKALAVANLLRAFMIDEENRILFGNNSTPILGASSGGANVSIGGNVYGTATPAVPKAPTFVGANTGVGSGGTINTTGVVYQFYQTILTGPNQESLPSAVLASVASAVTTNSFLILPTLTTGAIGYNIYFRLTGDTGFTVYPTNGKAVSITSYVAQTTPILPVADTSSNSLAFPGILQQLFGSAGNTTSVGNAAFTSGATITNLNGPQTFSTASTFGTVDNLMYNIWNNGKGDPDWLVMNAFESMALTSGTFQVGSGTNPWFIQPGGEQSGAIGGFRISRFANRVTGSIMDVKVHPSLPQGTLLALSMRMPGWYPGSDIPSVWSMEMIYDYLELDYPPSQPQWPIEVRNAGALLCYLPLINGVITGISTS